MCSSLAESDSGGIPRRELLLEKTVFPVRQKGVPPLLLPASVLQLPRCLVRICNLFLTNHKIANLTVSKNAIAAGKTDCKIEFASQMWATRPHLGSIFEKLLHRKTFQFMQWLLWNMVLRKNNCVRFGRFALLSAFVLFAGGCVVRIAYEFFLDYSLLEVFCF